MFIRTLVAAAIAVVTLNAAAVEANTASRADLETVKGVGPGLSGKIVDARKTAPFKDWSDLVDRVGGIGPDNAARFSQAGMTVSGAAYQAGTASASPAKPVKAEAKPKTPKDKGNI